MAHSVISLRCKICPLLDNSGHCSTAAFYEFAPCCRSVQHDVVKYQFLIAYLA
jgi:hypothetical protein